MIKTIGCVQFEVQFGDKPANFAKVEKLLAEAPDSSFDLLVLPELCFTGYEFKDANEVAEHAEAVGKGPTSDYIAGLASRHNSVVVAGYPEAGSDGRYYNSSMLVTPDGQFSNYRKLHLFSRENDLFAPGDAPPRAVDTPAGRIGMMICFDWFFPETARLLAIDGAQVIAHPSNLVLPYCQRAMYARSVENHVFSITANRIGIEERTGRVLTFTGASQVLAVDGMPMATAAADSEEVLLVSADLSAADNKQLNPYNNLLSSRRTEHYQDLLPIPGTCS